MNRLSLLFFFGILQAAPYVWAQTMRPSRYCAPAARMTHKSSVPTLNPAAAEFCNA